MENFNVNDIVNYKNNGKYYRVQVEGYKDSKAIINFIDKGKFVVCVPESKLQKRNNFDKLGFTRIF